MKKRQKTTIYKIIVIYKSFIKFVFSFYFRDGINMFDFKPSVVKTFI